MTSPSPAPTSQLRSRLSLIAIVSVFALPILAALALNLMGWMPGHSRNFGEVVHPPQPLRDIVLVHATDARTSFANHVGTWTLLVRVPATCDAACWQRVAVLDKVRTSLGRNAEHLVVVLLDREPPDAWKEQLGAMQFAAPTTPLPGRMGAPLATGPELWLVNPNGLAEMRYPPGFKPAELRKDLGKLIR